MVTRRLIVSPAAYSTFSWTTVRSPLSSLALALSFVCRAEKKRPEKQTVAQHVTSDVVWLTQVGAKLGDRLVFCWEVFSGGNVVQCATLYVLHWLRNK